MRLFYYSGADKNVAQGSHCNPAALPVCFPCRGWLHPGRECRRVSVRQGVFPSAALPHFL